MGFDPFSPIALALINVLCVPAGDINRERFDHLLSWLNANHATRYALSDDAQHPNTAGQSDRDSSTLLFNFSPYGDADVLQDETFFEPNRQPQVVVGLIDGMKLMYDDVEVVSTQLHDARQKLQQFAAQLPTVRPATRLLVFDASTALKVDDVVFFTTDKSSVDLEAGAWLPTVVDSVTSRALERLESGDVLLPTLSARFDRLNGAEARRDSKVVDARRQSVASNSSRTTTPSQVPNTIAEDASQNQKCGMIVYSAMLIMQKGLWTQALGQFTDGARAARDSAQAAWHAKALEGILGCMILLGWTGRRFQIPQDCYPTGRGLSSSSAVHSISDANRNISEKFAGGSTNCLQALTAMLPGLLATIMNLYDRAATGYGDNFPKLLACEARVRLAVTLVVVRRCGGVLGPQALEELLGLRDPPEWSQPLETPSLSLVLRSASLSNLFIESIIEAQAHLPVQSASVIYLAVCKYLHELKLDRKQGFYLKDILQRLPPVFVEARRSSSANGQVSTSGPDRQQQEISCGVRSLLLVATDAYGLPSTEIEKRATNLEEIYAQNRQRLSSWYSVFTSGDIATKLEVLRLCVRVSDALPDPIGSIQFMSLLLHIARQSLTVVPGPANALPLISSEEQARLVNGINNATASANTSIRLQYFADYWDDFLVRGVTLFEHPSAGKLVPHSSQDLSLTSGYGTNKKDPFIYNPFAGSGLATGPAVLVKDEIASFEVVLQNPLEVSLEVESISLIADGCKFDASNHNVVLGPLSVQVFTLQGTPREKGTLRIVGCKAKVKNCREQSFAIFTTKWKPPQIIKRRNTTSKDLVPLPESKTLELTVVDPLPSLIVDKTSLVSDSLMLLDGEMISMKIVLENTSDLEADLVLFSYQDSASKQLQDTLVTKDLQPADMYELQHQLSTRPAIKRISKQEIQRSGNNTPAVDANSKRTFEFSILGKPGLTEVTILIDYAYIGKPRSEVEGTFYTRQLRCSANVTVNASVDITRCNILSIPPSVQQVTSRSKTEFPSNASSESPGSSTPLESCLLQLDLRSIWQTPIRITVETRDAPNGASQTADDTQPSSWTPVTTLTLLPGHVDRTLIQIPKVYVPDPFTPIPSLSSSRQFVVSASKLSLEAELASRETFWYREQLCNTIRIKWVEEHGHSATKRHEREGEIDIRRGLRLSSRMIDALRIEHVQVTFDLKPVHANTATEPEASDAIKRINNDPSNFELQRNVFAILMVKVTNWTRTDDLKLLLRLQPSLHNQPHNLAMDLSKKFLWSGVLQRVLKGPIKSGGGTAEAELGIVALCKGVYEVNATVEEIRARRRGFGGGETEEVSAPEIGEKVERRIWYARRPCLIRVVDEEADT